MPVPPSYVCILFSSCFLDGSLLCHDNDSRSFTSQFIVGSRIDTAEECRETSANRRDPSFIKYKTSSKGSSCKIDAYRVALKTRKSRTIKHAVVYRIFYRFRFQRYYYAIRLHRNIEFRHVRFQLLFQYRLHLENCMWILFVYFRVPLSGITDQ